MSRLERCGSAAMVLVLCTACSSSIMRVGSQYAKKGVIGPSGGTLTVSATDDATIQGTSITIPAGALTTSVNIEIGATNLSVVSAGALGPAIDFEPSGTVFTKPVTMTIPLTQTGSHVAIKAVEADGTSRTITAVTVANSLATFQVSGFTLFGGFDDGSADGGDGSDGGGCTPSCTGDAACGSSDGCGGACNANCAVDGGCTPNCQVDTICGASDGCGGRCTRNCTEDGGTSCAECIDNYEGNTSCCMVEGTTTFACVNFYTDSANCGECGNSCGGGACRDGSCADGGATSFDGGCTPGCGADSACGSSDGCGGTCIDNCTTDGGETCAECIDNYDGSNSCCPMEGTTLYACTNLETDGNNCGSCGNACQAPTYACVDGSCGCQPPGILCGEPDAGVPAYCVDPTGDNNNCGSCGNVCSAPEGCLRGTCQTWSDGG